MAKRKPICKTPITQHKYDTICMLYQEYKENSKMVCGMLCRNVFDLYSLMNNLMGTHYSERTLRRIYRGEYDRDAFPA